MEASSKSCRGGGWSGRVCRTAPGHTVQVVSPIIWGDLSIMFLFGERVTSRFIKISPEDTLGAGSSTLKPFFMEVSPTTLSP